MIISTDGRIPESIRPLLQGYLTRLAQGLPGRVAGCYLEGSLALGGYNPRLSDIDFLTVLNSPATPADFEQLTSIHRAVLKTYPRPQLEGTYVQAADLGCREDGGQPFLSFHDGRLKWKQRYTLQSITWWILKNHGIALLGPPPEHLDFDVEMEDLLQGQRENLNSYWASFTTRLDGRLALLSDWGVEWTVLGVLRQVYTLREHRITTKVKAGEYALACLPARWHAIIREAIALRDEPKRTAYRSRLARARETLAFLRWVVGEW